jgi:hypothetical protein
MQVMIPRRLTGPATLVVALAALAGCGNSGDGVAAGQASASAQPSAVASVSAQSSASVPRSAQAPSALLDDALSAMQAQASVHISCTVSDAAPSRNGVEYEDIGAASGRVIYTEGTLSVANVLVSGIDYRITNSASLLAANGVPEAESEKLVGKWISIRPGESYGSRSLNYTVAISSMTLASQASQLRMTGPLKRTVAAVVGGKDVYGVSGTANLHYAVIVNGQPRRPTETVYIAASGAPLPVRVSAHISDGTGVTCDYSSWGVDLGLTAPAHSVPLTSIPAS